MMTRGEIGVLLVSGEQVGGFLAWEANVDISSVSKPKTTVYARACWLFKDVLSDDIEAMLYFMNDGKLVMANQSRVEIHTPLENVPEDTLIHRQLKMVFKDEQNKI